MKQEELFSALQSIEEEAKKHLLMAEQHLAYSLEQAKKEAEKREQEAYVKADVLRKSLEKEFAEEALRLDKEQEEKIRKAIEIVHAQADAGMDTWVQAQLQRSLDRGSC